MPLTRVQESTSYQSTFTPVTQPFCKLFATLSIQTLVVGISHLLGLFIHGLDDFRVPITQTRDGSSTCGGVEYGLTSGKSKVHAITFGGYRVGDGVVELISRGSGCRDRGRCDAGFEVGGGHTSALVESDRGHGCG